MKKTLALILTFIMVLALVPSVAFAETYVAWIDGTGYETLEAAVNAAKSGETITLGEGKYTLYEKKANVSNKDLTFVGAGTDKTTWLIGPKVPDPEKYGTEYNSDYSFDVRNTEAKETVTFKNMTLQSGRVDYLGFAGTDNTIVEGCIIEGKTFYWGYTSAIFTQTTFKCPDGDYALWSYSSPTMTFDNCIFNSSGKVINVYTDNPDIAITVNFNNCTVTSTNPESLSVMNINDAIVKSFTINFNGKNTINDIKADGIHETDGSHASAASNTNPPSKKTSTQATCSKLFEFNIKHGSPTNKTTVTIDGETVWKDGKRVSHAIDTANDKYTDGYKDNAFIITEDETFGYVKTCKYCGYTEPFYGELSNEIELDRTVMQGQEVNANPKDTYKVNGSSGITVDYTATMDMTKLQWEKQGSLSAAIPNPWLMLATQPDWITEDTVVFLKFTFDKNIDLEAFKATYEAAVKAGTSTDVLMLTSDMFEIADGGVTFGPTKDAMTIKCKWKKDARTNNSTIILKGCGLPVNDNWGGNKIEITNSGCVSGMVHIKKPRPEAAVAMAEIGPNVAVNQESIPTPPVDYTIQIPIVGGCAADKFTLYYGGGSSGDSGHSYYYPTTTPVPVIVIPPKTGDMTVWQSILHFLGIK